MASSSQPRRNYDVFLNFRGKDIGNNFVGHLCKAFYQASLRTKELRKREAISPSIMRAIKELLIAIIIFSESYASSWWCLEELAKILECEKMNEQDVMPVFYKVESRAAKH
ncbi:hypothetical protein EUGRSUZ_H01789 [Eucalyptus grandis]|uniref:Uncharacterized protein n=2 Tax=Eucalyptus grandis TaxID=71139 RepID=A0ACC3JRX5_EUCGR|nr:hypothetical protein EUGRSUZ_H01789 [Eucalyptus grandis]